MSISGISSYSSYLYDYAPSNSKTSASSTKSSGADAFFSKVDSSQDGTVDQSELQSLVDEITASTGQSVDVASLFSEYDANGDGSYSDDELKNFMQSNDLKPADGPKGPPPGGMGPQGASSDEDEDDYSASEYYLQLLNSLQSGLYGDNSSSDSNTSAYGSLFQSNYDSVIQSLNSQYSAEA